MAEAKKILVVDDHFEMLELLRTMLAMSNQDYEVLAVPSAEEGLLELKRTRFDLLITDVRLPGMSGFDLIRQVKRLKRPCPVIIITAYSSRQGQEEAAELGVQRYFRKPLDTDAVLTAVHKALYGDTAPLRADVAKQPPPVATDKSVEKRLDVLRADTGAAGLMLLTVQGEVILTVGDRRGLSWERLATAVAANMASNFELGAILSADPPLTIQYHNGSQTELYLVNIDSRYTVAMLFDAQARRGRIGTIWVFAQRAIKELAEMLPELPATLAPAPAAPEPPEPARQETSPFVEKPATAVSPIRRKPKPKTEPEPTPIAPEEAAALANLLKQAPPAAATSELDAFWDDALSEGTENATSSGLTLEEARARGLLTDDFSLPSQTED